MSNNNEVDTNAKKEGGDIEKTFRDIGDPVLAKPLEVKVMNNFDKAFKAFRALVQKERILSLYKEKQRFEKRSDKKRRKHNESMRKAFEMENKAKYPDKKKDKYLKKQEEKLSE